MGFDVTAVIAPIGQDAPCGTNPRAVDGARDLYYRIKDSRNAARGEERATVPGEPIRLAPQWRDVRDLALRILTDHGKDIEILAWLAEAEIRIGGFDGLSAVFEATRALVDAHWDDLHSIGDGEVADKVAPFGGLNGVGAEGTLVQPVRLTPLVPEAKFAELSLWDYQLSQREKGDDRKKALDEAVAEAGVAAMSARHGEAVACLAAFDALMRSLDNACGADSPPGGSIRGALVEAATAIRLLASLEEHVAVERGAEPDVANASSTGAAHAAGSEANGSGGAQAGAGTTPIGSLVIGSRDEAFEALLLIAHHFRRTEPQSPIAASIETLVRRGRMEFADLLGELLPDPAMRAQVLTAVGIQVPGAGTGNGGATS